jgi:atypical dual specificity phosphatase
MMVFQERRRLKERFPSLALAATDERECQMMLSSYQGLLLSKHLCEGNCPMGEVCPTGICRSPSKT